MHIDKDEVNNDAVFVVRVMMFNALSTIFQLILASTIRTFDLLCDVLDSGIKHS